MKLVIAEKPSMGKTLQSWLKKNNMNEYKVTWQFGHMLQLVEPEEYNEKWKYWYIGNLPIIPEKMRMKIIEDKGIQDQVKLIKKLMDECEEIVHAGDPDREGQLLVDELLEYLGNTKPVKRIWLASLDDISIKRAFDDIRDNSEYVGYKIAAQTRSEIDWLVGMNYTRAFTHTYKKQGKPFVSIGRVQTPTLKLIVDNFFEIENFSSVKFYTLKGYFKLENGYFQEELEANLILPKDLEVFLNEEGRLLDRSLLDHIAEKVNGKLGDVTNFERAMKTTPHPLGYNLSLLQATANKKYGIGAKELLNIAQKLYEDKLISYPRSDCQYLPMSQYGDKDRIIANLKSIEAYQHFQEENPKKSRIWNDKKITAHHAIIPTGDLSAYHRLSHEQKNIFHLVVEMYLTQFLKEYLYEEINIDIFVEGYQFNRKIKIEKDAGWKRLTQSDDDEEQERGEYSKEFLEEINRARKMWHIGNSVAEKNSQPPKRYTEGTLIKAMENIGSKIANLVKEMTQDIDKQKQLLEKYRKIFNETSGIGTEATRAEIIETLKKRNYIELKKKFIYPTETGISLIKLIADNQQYKEKFEFLISPLTTAHIELELKKIQNGEKGNDRIMAYYELKLKELKQYERIHNSIFQPERIKIAAENIGENDCPRCGKALKKRSGKNGEFMGCSDFPDCRYTRDIKKEVSTIESSVE